MKKKPVLFLLLLIVATVGVLSFIRFSNDHRECEEKTVQKTNTKGETIFEKQHVCREAFSF